MKYYPVARIAAHVVNIGIHHRTLIESNESNRVCKSRAGLLIPSPSPPPKMEGFSNGPRVGDRIPLRI